MIESIIEKLSLITDEERQLLSGRKSIDRSLYMNGDVNIISGKKLIKEGKLITVRPHTRFVRFPEHSHDYIEAVYVCRGSMVHIINGDEVRINEGELLFLSQSTRHEILPSSADDIAVNFIILPEFFDGTLVMLGDEDTPLRRFIVNCLKNESDIPYLHFKASGIPPVQNLAENLIWTLINGAPNKRRIYQTTMGLLFLQMLSYTECIAYKNKQDEIILQTLRYIEEHYRDGSLTGLAGQMHYDLAWLSREIKRKTGKTYTELLQDKRLSQACFLLKNTDLAVDDIAYKVGYRNISYFHRLFRKRYGVSPRSYRVSLSS